MITKVTWKNRDKQTEIAYLKTSTLGDGVYEVRFESDIIELRTQYAPYNNVELTAIMPDHPDTLCYAPLGTDGPFFLPADDQKIPNWPPVQDDNWYEVHTGQPVLPDPTAPRKKSTNLNCHGER